MSLLQMSFSGAVFILMVIIIRAAAINKLPKKTFLILWGIAILRLTVPFSILSALSVYSFINHHAAVNTPHPLPMAGTVPAVQEEPLKLAEEIAALPTRQVPSVSVWSAVWLSGMILCAAFFAASYLRCRFEFQTSLPVHNEFVNQWLKENRWIRPVCVRQSDRIPAPLTYGIFKPVILMPKNTDWKNKTQLQFIFLHEYIHICRYDAVTKLVSAFALCIHWFNPLVWVMYVLFNRDMESACDESVIQKLGESSKPTYAHMLIRMEAEQSGLLPFCNGFSKNAIEERITAIMIICPAVRRLRRYEHFRISK